MKKPLFVSDRPFNRDVCSDKVIYFDPNDHFDIANKIYQNLIINKYDADLLIRASEHARQFGSAETRAKQLINILDKISSLN